MTKEERKERRNNLFYQRMLDLGYDEVTEFVRETKVRLSFETCRRAIYDNRQNINFEQIIILMQALDFTPQDIRRELKARGDKILYKLISDSKKGMVLNRQEKRVIDSMRNIPGVANMFLGHIDLYRKVVKEAKEK